MVTTCFCLKSGFRSEVYAAFLPIFTGASAVLISEKRDSPEARLIARRSRRLIGRELAQANVIRDAGDMIGHLPELGATAAPLPKRTSRSEPLREHILDVAERLFARWTYTGVSIRDVTDMAQTRLGNINYHFGSKQNLYLEVLRRRGEPLAAARIAAIDAVIATDLRDAAFVGAMVEAYLRPALAYCETGDPGWRHFFELSAHACFSQLWPDEVVTPYFHAPVEAFTAGIQARFPKIAAPDLEAIALLVIGPSVFMLARDGHGVAFTNTDEPPNDIARLAPALHRYLTGGICAVLGIVR